MRIVTAALVALFLAGCSGSSINPIPQPSPTDLGLSVATQRFEAQVGMVEASAIDVATTVAIVIHSFNPLVRRVNAPSPCKNGVRTTIVISSPESAEITVDTYYHPNCTVLLTHAVLNATLASPASLKIAGTMTDYSPSGTAIAFGTIDTTTTLGSTTRAVTHGTIARTAGGPPVLSFGLTCTFAKASGCGFGSLATIGSQSLGASGSLNNVVASGSSKDGTTSLLGYQGAPGSLTLTQGKGNAWSIAGGTQIAKLTGTFTETVDASTFLTDGTLVLKDGLANASTSLTFGTRAGIGQGLVAETSSAKSFATFSTDPVGDGTIDYSDGTTGKILTFIITN